MYGCVTPRRLLQLGPGVGQIARYQSLSDIAEAMQSMFRYVVFQLKKRPKV